MDAKQVLSMAVRKERRARMRYIELARSCQTEALKQLFSELAEQEAQHARLLQSKAAEGLSGDLPDLDVGLSGAESIGRLGQDQPELLGIAFLVAIRREKEAMELYDRCADATADEGVREMFRGLAAAERVHAARLLEASQNALDE